MPNFEFHVFSVEFYDRQYSEFFMPIPYVLKSQMLWVSDFLLNPTTDTNSLWAQVMKKLLKNFLATCIWNAMWGLKYICTFLSLHQEESNIWISIN